MMTVRGKRIAAGLILAMIALVGVCPALFAEEVGNAARLRDKYASLAEPLSHNPFQRQLYLKSTESESTLTGDVYAAVDYPFASVNATLNDPAKGPANWCDMLILHLNVKYCHASANANNARLTVNLGKKVEEKLSSTYRVQFNYRAVATGPEYFQVNLDADTGPMSTRDYRIVLEATSIAAGRTFLHLTYSYSYGAAGRMAMKAYLATLGRGKVGFTNARDPTSGQAEYIGGVRGLTERNTMRYYLAIDSYLSTLSAPPDKRLDQRLAKWFDATEQYSRQLHEVDRDAYMSMKRNEYQRQQVMQ